MKVFTELHSVTGVNRCAASRRVKGRANVYQPKR